MKRLTIAHYKEDLSWLNGLDKSVELFIYHKKDDNGLSYNDKVILSETEFELSNVGRESHTYLKHIVDNYDSLKELEYFSQGDTNHCFGFIDFVNNDSTIEYRHVTDYPHTFNSYNGYIPIHMKEKGYETKQIWDALFNYPPPEVATITPYALFKIDRDTILMHDKSIYQKCLDFFADNQKDNLNGWNFEYFWQLLFHPIHKK